MKNNVNWELTPEIVARHFLKNVSAPRHGAPEGPGWTPLSGTVRCDHPAGVRDGPWLVCRAVGWAWLRAKGGHVEFEE